MRVIKLQTLLVALAFLVGCGAAGNKDLLVVSAISSMDGTIDEHNIVTFIISSRNAVEVPVSDLMDISWSSPTVQTYTDSFIAPYKQDRTPIPYDQPIFFPLPTRVRVEDQRRGLDEPEYWSVTIAIIIALVISMVIRSKQTVVRYAGYVLKACAIAVLSIVGLCVFTHLVPTFAFYLAVRAVLRGADKVMEAIGVAVISAVEFTGFLLVPSYGPNWMTTNKTNEPIAPTVETAPAAPEPMIEVPAAWQGERPLHESWADDEDEPHEVAKSKSGTDSMIVLITLLRIRTLRQEMENKLAELESLEAVVRRIQKT